jgi:hypothetical protein
LTIAFIACLERGSLEEQTILLCRSIRRFAGRYRDAPIYTFQPREGAEISPQTLAVLEQLGVSHSTERLNREFKESGYVNKIMVSARAEEVLKEEVLVFVDSDTIMTGEPLELDLPMRCDAAALPVNNRRLGSTGPGDTNEPYWQRMYDICGVEKRDAFVKTVIDEQYIRPYFNSGLIAVRRSAGLFTQWKSDFLRLIKAGCISEATGITGMDEFSLAVSLGRAIDRMRILDLRYNYPLQLLIRPALHSPFREAQLEDLIHVHYRFWLNHPDFWKLVQPPLNQDSEIVQWLNQYLPLKPVIDDAWIAEMRRTPGQNIHRIEGD